MQDIQEIKECPDCASSNIVHNLEREQVVCRECGLIYEPLTPDVEEKFEASHDLTMPRPKTAAKTAKAKPKAAKAKTKKRK
jgi:transcription initiation factor TFIIIB Brf1 subunit/transcription initiation factor TFIIB